MDSFCFLLLFVPYRVRAIVFTIVYVCSKLLQLLNFILLWIFLNIQIYCILIMFCFLCLVDIFRVVIVGYLQTINRQWTLIIHEKHFYCFILLGVPPFFWILCYFLKIFKPTFKVLLQFIKDLFLVNLGLLNNVWWIYFIMKHLIFIKLTDEFSPIKFF